MISLKDWKDYYNNVAIAKKIEKDYLIKGESFDKYMPYFNNYFIGSIGYGLNAINEISLQILAQALVNQLNNRNIKENYNILLCHDGTSKDNVKFLDAMGHTFLAARMKVIKFANDEGITLPFLKHTLNKTKNIDIVFYISKYTIDNKYTIALFNREGKPFGTKILGTLAQACENINIHEIKEFIDVCARLDFAKLMNEYIESIYKHNYLLSGNKLIKIACIEDNLNHSFFKKIMGKNDFEYKIIKHNAKEEGAQFINISTRYLRELSNIKYLVKFSYDHKRVYFYSRIKSSILMPRFQLIDINLLIANFLVFTNNVICSNNKFTKITSVKSTCATRSDLFNLLAKKYYLNYEETFTYTKQDLTEPSFLYFNEKYDVITSWNQGFGQDAYLTFSMIVNMLNYYETQSMKLDDINAYNLSQLNHNLLSSFSINCSLENLEPFETKLFAQSELNRLEISATEDLRHINAEKERYIAKIYFEENEWLVIKYSFELKKLIFICQETKTTKGEFAKKFKRFFTKFLKNYEHNFMFQNEINDTGINDVKIDDNQTEQNL
ncbi:hypothetical protein [Metamycoplasma neophronis]|uniref:Alpha-D-phosphohexomutase alpha/beta/alpha domain-containing protein n=1 Tax=Metamycoplasma neophronis TaxID=872983 RepID=A0ABY2Z0A7_9BACT|nr:hypothetical protein [Metamycoplasma neophronis]TPR53373.1 hypothetical protein FJR74_02565 [Metamycoplasma neophronis]